MYTANHSHRAHLLAATAVIGLTLTGCRCPFGGGSGGGGRSVPPATAIDFPPCESVPELVFFGFDAELNPGDQAPAGQSFQWTRFDGISFKPLTNSVHFEGTTQPRLIIRSFQKEDVGYYGRQVVHEGAKRRDPIPCGQVYNLMGTTNANGLPPIWGYPVLTSGNQTINNCSSGEACPGAYAKYVSYSLGWLPAGGPGPTLGQDGNTSTRPLTKISYACAPLPLPRPTPPTCGCNGVVTVINPVLTKYHKFTIYFPQGVNPQVPHPLDLINFK